MFDNSRINAEIELQSEDQIFKKPNFIGKEVSGQPQYYNSMLIKMPFKKWGSQQK